jgi:hypothetical protein
MLLKTNEGETNNPESLSKQITYQEMPECY